MTYQDLPPFTSLNGEQWVYIALSTLGFLVLIVVLGVERKKKKTKRVGVSQASETEEEVRPMSEKEEARLDEQILQRSRQYLRSCRRGRRRHH
jgi:hypothetical protein